MLSSRTIARSLPRAVASTRSFSTQRFSQQLPVFRARQCAPWRPSSFRPTAAFSTSCSRFESEGQVNTELSAKLESELAMETEMRDTDATPEHLKEYLDNSPFKIQDFAGHEEVVMTRTFGDEKIKVTFSIDDMNNIDEDADSLQDPAMEDEFDDPSETTSDGANTKGAINQGRPSAANVRVAPEDSIAPSDQEGDEGEEPSQEPSFPAHVQVVVERPGKGALQIEAIAQDGLMVIDNIYFFKDAKYIEPEDHKTGLAGSKLYTGPPFGNLDEDLQVLFEKYLDERGINTTMALFIPEYIDFKEQKEYLHWLTSVKKFVD